MKTSFKYKKFEQARARQIKFEEQTGLKWDCFHAWGKWHFVPVVTRDTPLNNGAADTLRPHIPDWALGFVQLAEVANMSLADVLSAAKTLVKRGECVPIVSRMGNVAGICRK